jgi:hypothetical protein
MLTACPERLVPAAQNVTGVSSCAQQVRTRCSPAIPYLVERGSAPTATAASRAGSTAAV